MGERYTDEGEIARGGMGVIYRVNDRHLDRTLAMKRMLGALDLSGGEAEVDRFARFMEEAHVTAQLDHPGIVPIHDLGEDEDGCAYYTMKLVRGRELGGVIKLARDGADGWNLARLVGVLVHVCQAVAYAHGKGVIHRDLKPANIMVGDLGEVYVMDWGLARQLGREDVHDIRLKFGDELARSGMDTIVSPRRGDVGSSIDAPLMTMDGAVIGTPAYMPPEQAAGIVDQVDHLSDIYSLGAVLYEVLAAQSPYMDRGKDTKPTDVLTALSNGPPTPVKRVRPEAPAELVAICEKSMSRSREDRYGTCLELANELQAFVDGRVVRAYETGRFAELKKWVLRNKVTSAAAAVAVATLMVLAVFQAVANRKLGESLASEERARQDAQAHLAGSYAASAFRHARDGDTDLAVLWFAKAAIATPAPEERIDHQVRVAAWSRESFPLVAAFRSGHLDSHALTFHQSGRFLRATDDDSLAIWDLESGERVSFGESGELVQISEWNATGDRFVYRDPKSDRLAAKVVSWPSLETELEIPRGREQYSYAAFDASGERLALGGTGFEVWSLSERRRLCYFRRDRESVLAVAFEPGGKLVALNDRRVVESFVVEDLGGGLLGPPLFSLPGIASYELRFRRAAAEVLIEHRDGGRSWYSTSTGEKLQDVTSEFVAHTESGGWHIARDSGAAQLYQPGGAGQQHRIALRRSLVDAAFVPGRQWFLLASQGGHVGLHEYGGGALVAPVTQHRLPITGLAVSEDGELAAVANGGGLIRVFDLARGVDSDRLKIGEAQIRSGIAMHPDGEHVAAICHTAQGLGARVYELDSGEIASSQMTLGGQPLGFAFSPGGETLAALVADSESTKDWVDRSGQVKFWDWREGSRKGAPVITPSPPRSAAFCPKDTTKLIVWCSGGQVVMIDSADRSLTPLFETGIGRERHPYPDRDGTVAFSPDGSVFAVYGMESGMNNHVYVWDMEERRLRFPPIEVPQTCHQLDFHPIEAAFSTVSGTLPANNEGRFWSLVDGSEIAPPIFDKDWPFVGRFAGEDGRLFVIGGRGGVLLVYDWRNGGAPLATIRAGGTIRAIAQVPGRPGWLLSGRGSPGEAQIQLWDILSGSPLAPPLVVGNRHSSPTDIFFSSDGQNVLVSGVGVDLMRWRIAHLIEPELARGDNLEEFLRFAELRAGVEARDDGKQADLEIEEWMRRWRAFR